MVKFYCHTGASERMLSQTLSNLTPRIGANMSGIRKQLLSHGVNIIERQELPRAASYACDIIIDEYDDGAFKILKNRDDLAIKYNTSYEGWKEILDLIVSTRTFSAEQISLYLTDPEPISRTIIQHYLLTLGDDMGITPKMTDSLNRECNVHKETNKEEKI